MGRKVSSCDGKSVQSFMDFFGAIIHRLTPPSLFFCSYGGKGDQLINVTYVGDTLIATKATGDVNVPRGEVSFTANLAPRLDSALEPLKVSFDSQSGATEFPRYPGKGQIAKAGFVESQYVEGQLIMFERHFSFVWIPSRHHVLFRRPTPEQTLSLLRDTISKEDELENMREHVARCFDMDMTTSIARYHAEQGQEPFRRIAKEEDLKALDDDKSVESKDNGDSFQFWQLNKWRQYLDNVLRDDSSDKSRPEGQA